VSPTQNPVKNTGWSLLGPPRTIHRKSVTNLNSSQKHRRSLLGTPCTSRPTSPQKIIFPPDSPNPTFLSSQTRSSNSHAPTSILARYIHPCKSAPTQISLKHTARTLLGLPAKSTCSNSISKKNITPTRHQLSPYAFSHSERSCLFPPKLDRGPFFSSLCRLYLPNLDSDWEGYNFKKYIFETRIFNK
jgi:hypothetical protein